MTVRQILDKRNDLLEEIKVYETLDEYIDTFLSKDNRGPESFMIFAEDKYVSEDSIIKVRQNIYKQKEVVELELNNLEEMELKNE
jgi:hypothetical protein